MHKEINAIIYNLKVHLGPGLDPGRRDAYGTIVASVHTKYHGAVHLQAADT